MEGRISVGVLSFCLLCAGCLTPNGQKGVVANATPGSVRVEETPKVVKKEDGPKRNPKPSTEIAFGRMKEMEADTDQLKKQPEIQARLRDEARTAYQQALKLEPNNLEAAHSLIRLYTKTGDCERAQELCRKTMTQHPKDGALWYDLGSCHLRKREFQESARCFSKALELDPENREYMKKLGFTLAWMGQFDQGFGYLARSQGSALAHYNLARVHLQRDQTDLARQHLQVALRENSQLDDARELLASLDQPGVRRDRVIE